MGKGEAGNLYQFTDPVQHRVQMLLAHGVVAPGVVVGGILLARDQLLRVEQLTVGAGTDLIWQERKMEAEVASLLSVA